MECYSFFRDVVGIGEEELARTLADSATVRSLRKGERVLETGDHQDQISFLASGIARSFTKDAEGREVTDCIVFKAGSTLSPSVDLGIPSPATVEMLTEGEVVFVPASLVAELLETSLAANHLYIRIVNQAWHDHYEARRVVSQMRGRERYLWFLDRYPDIINLVPNKYVASLLGMTPVSLSRLRTELREEGVTQ